MTKLEQPILRIYDQNQLIRPNQIQLSTLDFFVNPDVIKWRPLKQTKLNNNQHFSIAVFHN